MARLWRRPSLHRHCGKLLERVGDGQGDGMGEGRLMSMIVQLCKVLRRNRLNRVTSRQRLDRNHRSGAG
jgi:hypothetical protein